MHAIGQHIRSLSSGAGLVQYICHPLSRLQQVGAHLTTHGAFTSVTTESDDIVPESVTAHIVPESVTADVILEPLVIISQWL